MPLDFDPGYGVGPPDATALEEDLFGDLIGCDDVKKQLSRIRSTFLHAERLGRDPLEVHEWRQYACGGGRSSANQRSRAHMLITLRELPLTKIEH